MKRLFFRKATWGLLCLGIAAIVAGFLVQSPESRLMRQLRWLHSGGQLRSLFVNHAKSGWLGSITSDIKAITIDGNCELPVLTELPNVEILTITCNRDSIPITSNSQLPSLEYLTLQTNPPLKLTPSLIDALSRLPKLRGVNFDSSEISDDEISLLLRLDRLDTISLEGSNITDAVIPEFLKFKRLKRLQLPNTKVTPEGIAILGQHPELRLLDLRNTPIDAANVSHLGELQNLRQLWLGEMQIDFAGLMALTKLQSLTELRSGSIKVTEIERTVFCNRMPNLILRERLPSDQQFALIKQRLRDTPFVWWVD